MNEDNTRAFCTLGIKRRQESALAWMASARSVEEVLASLQETIVKVASRRRRPKK